MLDFYLEREGNNQEGRRHCADDRERGRKEGV